jgi:membrane protease YdiL (CAAX protease family)
MEDAPEPVATPSNPWVDRIQAGVEILLLSGLVSGFLAALTLPLLHIRNMDRLLQDVRLLSVYLLIESAISLLLLIGLLKLHRESMTSIGLQWKHWKRNLLLGLALVPCLFMINGFVAVFFKLYLPKYFMDENPLIQGVHTPLQLILFAFSALIAGGFKEEIQRAFILNRFKSYLGGAGVGLILWSLAFGAGHYVQGVQGVVIASLYGFVFGVIYLLSGSLVAPIAAHGAYDVLAILAYWFFSKALK